ncbi:restriction modification system DNA specificity [Vibrio sp. B1FIG11]|uniref:restriction endonuclease subunit S n=1 Tax=Vibrio sp. B1FIG11 TaxID=2751177 RepID=UPI001AF6A981|nr:restriction endonuclease subunit S [Vibrio sp. B1FIG11]CAE6895386.1 restriction modification system DNA specificity [Vibrio sp. B1FIG11]
MSNTMIGQMPKYESYKESGEQWIDKVPSHWEIIKLKHLFYEKKHRQNMSLNCGAISFGHVVQKDDSKTPLSTKASYQEVLRGEFLINPLNLNYDLKSLRIGLSYIDVVVSAGYIVLKERSEIDKEYFKFLLHRYDVAYMKLLGSGVRQTINFNHIANSLLALPPLDEQKRISSFLNKKTAQIDEAIAIKQKQIELLKERKQIIIQQAVTQGLNPDAPMKDSGVDWIGEIPEHWGIVRFKNLFTQSRLPVRKGDGVVTSYRDGQVTLRSNRRVGGYTEAILEGGYQGIRKGQLVLNSMDAFEGAIGVSDSDGKCTPEYVICDPINSVDVSQYYFAYLLREMALAKYIQVICNAVRQRAVRIRYNNLAPLFMVVPPVKEQEDIVSFIEKESTKLDAGTKHLNEQISKLKEYKTTLINSVVTGKIKVTELA